MKKILVWFGAIFILVVIFVFAIALQVYNEMPEAQAQQDEITYVEEDEKPLTRLEIVERQSVQDWKDEIERKKKEAGA